MSEIRSSTNAIRNSALPQVEPKGVLPISTTISLGSVLVGEKSESARRGVLPITICTAIVSPMARAIPRIIAVTIPGLAAGSTICQMVCQ